MIVILVIAIGLLILVAVGLAGRATSSGNDPADELRDRLSTADQQITSEYRAAKRAMNNAAGQSWRNLIDSDDNLFKH